MSRYSSIDRRMWGDAKFRALSGPQPNAQSLWQYLLTCPESSAVPGAIRLGVAAIAEALGWPTKATAACLDEIEAAGMASVDRQARLVWLPNAIKRNAPRSPDNVKAWSDAWDELPECPLKVEAWSTLRGAMVARGHGFVEAFDEACQEPMATPKAGPKAPPKVDPKGHPMVAPKVRPKARPKGRHQDQDQEKEQEQERERRQRVHAGTGTREGERAGEAGGGETTPEAAEPEDEPEPAPPPEPPPRHEPPPPPVDFAPAKPPAPANDPPLAEPFALTPPPAPAPTPAERILAALRAHPSLAAAADRDVAGRLEGARMTKGTPLEQVEAAIAKAAERVLDDRVGGVEHGKPALVRMLRGFVSNASKRDVERPTILAEGVEVTERPQRTGRGLATRRVDPKTGYVHLTDERGRPAQGYDPSAPWARAVLNIPPVSAGDPLDEGDETPEARRAAG